MQLFFADPGQIREEAGSISITGGDVNHIRNVLRMRTGDVLRVRDGGEKEYVCSIAEFREKEVLLSISAVSRPDCELPNRIWLFQGLPKGDKMELIVQKAVELGAYAIVPVEMKRCVVRLDAKKAEKKVTRWQQIAESGAKQSGRMIVPRVERMMTFREALETAGSLDLCLVPYERAEGIRETRALLERILPGQSIGIFIGPEGGFEEEEVRQALEKGAHTVTLGRRILRTETAGMALLSALMLHLERE